MWNLWDDFIISIWHDTQLELTSCLYQLLVYNNQWLSFLIQYDETNPPNSAMDDYLLDWGNKLSSFNELVKDDSKIKYSWRENAFSIFITANAKTKGTMIWTLQHSLVAYMIYNYNLLHKVYFHFILFGLRRNFCLQLMNRGLEKNVSWINKNLYVQYTKTSTT